MIVWITVWLIFATYDYLVMVGAVYVERVLFAFLTLTIMDYSLLPLWRTWYLNLEYIISSFGGLVALRCVALHNITWHLELCRESMVVTVPVQHRLLGITMQLCTLLGMKAGVHMHTSLVWHSVAASYMDKYKGKSSCALIDICFMAWCWMWWRHVITNVYIMPFMVTHTAMWLMRVGYSICVPLTFTCLFVWIFGLVHMVATKMICYWCFSMVMGILYDLRDYGDIVRVISSHSFAP